MVNPISFGPSGINSQADFSPLANLGTIYQKAQQDQANKAAFAAFQQTGDPRALIGSGDMNLAQLGISAQNHLDLLKQQGVENRFRQNQDTRAAAAESRAAYEHNNTPDQYKKNPNYGQPGHEGEPEYTDVLAAATAASGNPARPIPFETLGGTKFLLPQPGGGYKAVDPATLVGAGAPTAVPGQTPTVPVQPNPADDLDPTTGRREGFLKTLDPQIQGYIKKVADYEIDPRTTSVKGGMREKLMSAVAQYDPNYNQNEFGARSKATKDFSTGTQGNIIRSFDVAIDHLDTLQKAATAMHNGDSRLLNEIRNKWREQTGSDLPTNFQSLVPLVSGEIAKAVIGSNNALSDREELRTNLQKSGSPDQIAGVIDGYKALMGGQLKGLKKQYEETTGKKDFDKRLRPQTLDALTGGVKNKNAPIKVTSPDEAAKLPPGTHIILPDGSPGVVPGG